MEQILIYLLIAAVAIGWSAALVAWRIAVKRYDLLYEDYVELRTGYWGCIEECRDVRQTAEDRLVVINLLATEALTRTTAPRVRS